MDLKIIEADKSKLHTEKEAIQMLRIGSGSVTYVDFHKPHVFEIFTVGYINSLAEYLRSRGDNIIIEVGAGDGRLSEYLRQKGIKIIATDDYSWDIPKLFDVEKISNIQALEKYSPNIIVSCWMPYGSDWTPTFRKFSSVKEYIIIGEASGGCVGSESIWEDHPGFTELWDNPYDKDLIEPYPFATQYCRTDSAYSNDSVNRHSWTHVFRRTK